MKHKCNEYFSKSVSHKNKALRLNVETSRILRLDKINIFTVSKDWVNQAVGDTTWRWHCNRKYT